MSIEPIENGAYRIRHLKVDAEIGDPTAPGFKPKLRLKRWGGECFLDIDFAGETVEEEVEEETDGEGNITKVKWKIKTVDDELELEYHAVDKAHLEPVITGVCNQCGKCCEVFWQGRLGYVCPHYNPFLPDKCEIHIDKLEQQWKKGDETYEEWSVRKNPECPCCFRPTMSELPPLLPECGFTVEWESTGTLEETLVLDIVLNKKPISNILNFPLKAEGLRFSHQTPLTLEENEQGSIRPPNVDGSYAVYHISKKNNQYETGKAFHIYRPIAEDALGNEAWCSIDINGYIDPTNLTVTVPQQFLDEAVYPITIDPDFGYTAQGGTSYTIGSSPIKGAHFYRAGSAWTMPVDSTANYIRAYIGSGSVGDVADCVVLINQKDSGGAGTHGQIATKENLACTGPFHWEEFTFADEILTQDTNYILNIHDDDGHVYDYSYYVKGDENGAVASYYELQDGAIENPWIVNPEGTTTDYSIYCNYDVTMDPPTVTTQDATGIGQGDPP